MVNMVKNETVVAAYADDKAFTDLLALAMRGTVDLNRGEGARFNPLEFTSKLSFSERGYFRMGIRNA